MSASLRLGCTGGAVSEGIFGQFIEHALNCIDGGVYCPGSPLSGPDGVRADVAALAKRLAPGVLRFPGGTVVCQYHWQDAVGPPERRVKRQNLIWGGTLHPGFGTAEFVTYCRRIGAEPMLCVNMASGTPEEAAAWVEYCNGTGDTHYANLRRSHGYDAPFGVKYWCIGNESYAEPDIGAQHDVRHYISDAVEWIKWMKLTDKTLRLVIVGCEGEGWNRPVLAALHPFADYLSLHHYSGTAGGLYAPFEGERSLRRLLSRAAALLSELPETICGFNPWYRFPPRTGKMQLALDEWNIWDYREDATYGLTPTYNWRDALWVASVLCLLVATPEVGMANMAQLVNVLAPIVADEGGAWLQTIAYPWLAYRHALLGRRVETVLNSPPLDGTDGLPALAAAAVQNDAGYAVAVVNRDFAREHTLRLTLPDGTAPASARLRVLTAASPYAICTREDCCVRDEQRHVDAACLCLPAGSCCLLSIPAQDEARQA